MPRFSLVKTIEAKKLNKRTGVPTTDPAVAIPFGAIIDNVDEEGDLRRFAYQGELYRAPEDVLLSALDRGAPADSGGAAVAAAAPVAAAAEAAPAQAPASAEAKMVWEEVPSTHFQVVRAKVPGGWLVSTGAATLVFYPDPQHAWDAFTKA